MQAYNPHPDFVDFVDQFDTWQEAWDECERGDWMLWLYGRKKNPTITVQRMEHLGDPPRNADGEIVPWPKVDFLASCVACACTAEDLWPNTSIPITTLAIGSGIDQAAGPVYQYNLRRMLAVCKLSLTEFVAWVNRNGGRAVTPHIRPRFNSAGTITRIDVEFPGSNFGNRNWPVIEAPVAGSDYVHLAVSADMIVKDGKLLKINNITQQLRTSDPQNSRGTHRYGFSEGDITNSYSYSIITSCDYAHADLYMMMRYMEGKMKHAVSRVRAGATTEQDLLNAGACAARALCYAGFTARATFLNFCGAPAYDAARAKAFAARAPYTDDVQAKIAGYNTQLANYRQTPNKDTEEALVRAINAYKDAAKLADRAYDEALDQGLSDCADVVREFLPESPI